MGTAVRWALTASHGRWLVALSLALAMMLAAANFSVVAAQPMGASGSFTQVSFEISNERTAGPLILFDFTETDVLTGTFTGTSMIQGSCVQHPSGQAACVGVEMFTGSVDGEVGTVLFHVVAFPNSTTGTFHGAFTIVSGSGTGDLANLSGHGTFGGQGTSGTYAGTVDFGS